MIPIKKLVTVILAIGIGTIAFLGTSPAQASTHSAKLGPVSVSVTGPKIVTGYRQATYTLVIRNTSSRLLYVKGLLGAFPDGTLLPRKATIINPKQNFTDLWVTHGWRVAVGAHKVRRFKVTVVAKAGDEYCLGAVLGVVIKPSGSWSRACSKVKLQ